MTQKKSKAGRDNLPFEEQSFRITPFGKELLVALEKGKKIDSIVKKHMRDKL